MTEQITIRPATDAEIDEVAALLVEAYAEYAARMSPDAWSSFAQDIANVRGRLTDSELLVAEQDDQIVGAVTMFTDWRGVQQGTVGLRLLAVRPGARGTGVGRALLETAISTARERGKERVVLTVTQEMDIFRDLIDRMGFHRAFDLDHEPAPGVRIEGYALKLGD